MRISLSSVAAGRKILGRSRPWSGVSALPLAATNRLVMSCVFLALASLPGCAPADSVEGPACTAVACANSASDSVLVTFPQLPGHNDGLLPLALTVCADGESCVTASVTLFNGWLSCTITGGARAGTCDIIEGGDVEIFYTLDTTAVARSAHAPVTITGTVTNRVNTKVVDGSSAVEITTSTPNGDHCEPKCHGGRVTFTS
jgi:hypothetical protein